MYDEYRVHVRVKYKDRSGEFSGKIIERGSSGSKCYVVVQFSEPVTWTKHFYNRDIKKLKIMAR